MTIPWEMIFDGVSWEDMVYYLCDMFNQICGSKFPRKEFIITKSIGNIKDYKIRDLPTDEKKRAKRLKDLNCTIQEYKSRCLPAHVQLAERMRRRKQRVDVGSRLEYLVTTNGGIKAKLFDKLEHPDYFKEHSGILKIEYLYYLHLISTALDQLLEVGYKKEKFVLGQYKFRVKRQSMVNELLQLFRPAITFS